VKYSKAIKIAAAIVRKEIQRISVDANLYDWGIADYPYAKKCSDRRKELREVLGMLAQDKMEA
jgi:hypothetical protein